MNNCNGLLLAASLILSACSAPVQETTPTTSARPAPTSPALAVLVPSSASDAGTPSMADPNLVSQLRSLGNLISASHGIPSPSTMHAVAVADHQLAETFISGAVINDHAPVYVVRMTGGPFTAPNHPPNAPAPQGNVLTVTFNATTMRVTDIGIDPEAPDLTPIGQVTDLLAQ